MFAVQALSLAAANIMDDAYMPRGLWKRCIGRIPLGFAVHGVLLTRHVGGYWVYARNTVGGVSRRSHYLVGETWDYSAARIFQVRHGNGRHGSILGKRYYQRVPYKVPWPSGNPAAGAARTAFAAAVSNWHNNILTENEKIEYNRRADKMRRRGYNLYVSEYVKANA